MYNKLGKYVRPLGLTALLATGASGAEASITGLTGSSFDLTAKADFISAGDGQGIWMWGYANTAADPNGTMQYPGPTLIVNQGADVTVTLHNALTKTDGTTALDTKTSIVFPGQGEVSCTGTVVAPAITCEAGPGGEVIYKFKATNAGTYMYHSGTQSDLQTEMGLFGTLIVRPAAALRAYEHPSTAFGHEYLFVLSEVDVETHIAVEQDLGTNPQPSLAGREAEYWFINGRNGTDTLLPDDLPWFPTQPYGAVAQTHPGDETLLRVVQAGRDLHPFHVHGNNFRMIARDGRLLESAPGAGADLASSDFTLKAIPGETYDGLWNWTGKGLGWDIYGYTHATKPEYCDAGNVPNASYPANKLTQDASDRCKPLKVGLPNPMALTVGQGFSGSPYLGGEGALPAGESTLNVFKGMFFMWHSHTEKELTNGDVFPGGMMTFMIVQPEGAPIE